MIFKINVWSCIVIVLVLLQSMVAGHYLIDSYSKCGCDFDCGCSGLLDKCYCPYPSPDPPPPCLECAEETTSIPELVKDQLDPNYKYEWQYNNSRLSEPYWLAFPYDDEHVPPADGFENKIYPDWYYEVRLENGNWVVIKFPMPAA